jgi:FecR protein
MMRDEKPPLGPIEPGELPVMKAPDSIWANIVASLDTERVPAWKRFQWWQWRAAFLLAAFSLLVGVAGLWYWTKKQGPSWQVVRLDGSPSVGSKRVADIGRIVVGEWLQTDASSRARIGIGEIGSVEVEPNSRVRLLAAKPNENRIALARGEISAVVSAPPRLFFVDTPASTAVDLGCAYKMKTDESGAGLLRVSVGWVALEWKGRESLVPAGASCRTRPGVGPGTPYFEDASQALQAALAEFDFEKGGAGALETVRRESRLKDTLTLLHLLSRTDPGNRILVFDRMVELAPLPPGVSREKVLQLDAGTLSRWREELAWKW